MKNLFLVGLLLFATNSIAQIEFTTGDPELEVALNTINDSANEDLDAFKSQIEENHNIELYKIDDMLTIMEPAEVALAAHIKDVLEIDLDAVIKSYIKTRDLGWTATLSELGIDPGSAEFDTLKERVISPSEE